MKKNRLIPFNWLPAAWGLKGKTKLEAELDYYYEDGYEKEVERLNRTKMPAEEREKKKLDLELEYGKISEKIYEKNMLDKYEGEEKEYKQLQYEHKWEGLSDIEYEKRLATLNKEPWIKILDVDFSYEDMATGAFSLDWNEYFIEELKENGYGNQFTSDEEIVDQWLQDLCRQIAFEDIEDIDIDDLPQSRGPVIERTSKNGRTEYK